MSIRVALGAKGGQIQRFMIRQTCAPVVLGSVLGLVVAYWFARSGQDLLYKQNPHDLRIYGLVLLTLGLAAVAGAWLPARRVARTDPAAVLRTQ